MGCLRAEKVRVNYSVMSEKKWVASFVKKLADSLRENALPGGEIKVYDGKKLPYACQINEYKNDLRPEADCTSVYETDILVCDFGKDGQWTPRVVIECKLGDTTTHDALTYSAKAATHKQIHRYLRYGFLVGERDGIPTRLI